jgi:hypothetical protein
MRIITLIHGTWAREAPWTQEGSRLVHALQVADPETRIKRLAWSGGNSHAARLEAAERLVHHVRDCRKCHPAAKHYVIAHSHGGNVVRYALSLEDVSADLDGAVCLSTPFIVCRRKPESKELWSRACMFFLLGNFFLLNLVGDQKNHFHGISGVIGGILLLGFPFIFSLIVPFLFILLVTKMGPGIYRRWPKISGRWFFGSFEGASLPAGKFLIVRPSSDETVMGIGVFQLLTWLSNRVVKQLDGLYVNKNKIINFVFGVHQMVRPVVMFVIFCGSVLFATLMDKQETSTTVGLLLYFGECTIMTMLSILGFCSLLAVAEVKPGKVEFSWGTLDFAAPYEFLAHLCNGVLGLLYFPVIAVTSLFAVAFGWDMPFFSLFLQFSIEPLPPGNFSVFQLPVEDAPALSHSLPYDNPTVLEEIIRWMKRVDLDQTDRGGGRDGVRE